MVAVTNVAQHPRVSPPFVGDILTVYSHSESGWTFPTPGCTCYSGEQASTKCVVAVVCCGNRNCDVTVVVVVDCNGYRFGPVALLAITCSVENMPCGK